MKEEKMITASNKEVDEAVVPKKHDVLSRIKLMDTNHIKMFKTFSEWISCEVMNNDQVLVQTDFGFMGKDIPLTIRSVGFQKREYLQNISSLTGRCLNQLMISI